MSSGLLTGILNSRLDVLEEHIRAENEHNIEVLMKTFGLGAVLVINGKVVADRGRIRTVHEELGFSGQGGFSELRVQEEKRYVANDAIIMEQLLSGRIPGPGRASKRQGGPSRSRFARSTILLLMH